MSLYTYTGEDFCLNSFGGKDGFRNHSHGEHLLTDESNPAQDCLDPKPIFKHHSNGSSRESYMNWHFYNLQHCCRRSLDKTKCRTVTGHSGFSSDPEADSECSSSIQPPISANRAKDLELTLIYKLKAQLRELHEERAAIAQKLDEKVQAI